MRKFLVLFFVLFQASIAFSQDYNADSVEVIDYTRPQEYTIADIDVVGVRFLNPTHLISISGLHRGQKIKIPGTDISTAINRFWRYGLFADVKVVATKIENDSIYLEFVLTEQPRLNELKVTGLNKTETSDIKEKIDLKRGTQITNNVVNNTVNIIRNHFTEKGFFNVEVDVKQVPDTSGHNRMNVWVNVEKNSKVKIQEIVFEGNEVYTDKQLRKQFKDTKQRNLNIFKGAKYNKEEYEADKVLLLDYYNAAGYRDAEILSEELVKLNDKRIGLKIKVYEGKPYYIRSIRWVGNTKYPSDYLSRVLGVKEKGIYNKKELSERLSTDDDAISTLYMDNGYLFFNVTPVEVQVAGDSVDLELRMYEGEPATISKIIIKGNTKTNEHVVRRELYTRPGELFSKTDLMRSYREIANLGHFNPETIGVNPIPNPAEGTVDIEYDLEERANDQLELSGGWGGGYGFVGSIGVKFTNMALNRALDLSAWKPVPTGNGQTLSLKAQSNLYYHGFNISFMEPWLGGTKPNSLSVSLNYTIQNVGNSTSQSSTGSFKTLGGSVGLGKRLKWPDDYFSVYSELSYNLYRLKDYPYFAYNDGDYNMLTLKGVISRSSQDQQIYPRRGSVFSLGVQFTPPYSKFSGKDYAALKAEDSDESNYEVYKNVEFYKWTFSAAWYNAIVGDLVLALKTDFGALGFYNEDIGYPIFEKFDMGGAGLSGYSQYGTDVVPLRGYEDGSLTPTDASGADNGNVYSRYYAELRYPITLNPSATLYGLVFAEGGNIWSDWDEFNPYEIKRSVGVGIRAFLPMFGLLGFDWGYGFDPVYDSYNRDKDVGGSQFHFIIGQQF